MIFNDISDKQFEIFTFPHEDYDALICDGAVRSGKTTMMTIAFIWWAMERFAGAYFGICGRAVQVAERNIVKPIMGIASLRQRYLMRFIRSQSMLVVEHKDRVNYFYLFGGRDESSYTLIQGITLSGILFDEVALMPRSFVEQGITRTLSVDDAKLWFNCNPASPEHWFYKEWIQHPDTHRAKYLHFLMEDNPGLSEKAIQRAANSFSGVFYDRYIKGEWAKTEGLIYPMFDRLQHTFTEPVSGQWYVSIDYGISNPFSAGLWCISGNVAYRVKEYYHVGREGEQHTDEEYADAIETLAQGVRVERFIIDPSATSFIVCMRRRGHHVRAANNDVMDGIRNVSSALKLGRLRIHQSCTDIIRELGLYSWDEKANSDRPIKENDHACDEMRYFVRTILRRKCPEIDGSDPWQGQEHQYWTGKRY